ncbi:MAG: phage protease [Amaricoccus sp.]
MILNPEALDLAFKGFKAVYTDAYTKAPKVEWTALARELIGAKAYRYLSPVIRYSATTAACCGSPAPASSTTPTSN